MTKQVIISGGRISTENGQKESRALKVVVPQGMTGKKLAAWKKRNEAQICSLVENNTLPASIDAGDDIEGDREFRIVKSSTSKSANCQSVVVPKFYTEIGKISHNSKIQEKINEIQKQLLK